MKQTDLFYVCIKHYHNAEYVKIIILDIHTKCILLLKGIHSYGAPTNGNLHQFPKISSNHGFVYKLKDMNQQ